MAATGGGGGPSEGVINLCMAYEQRTLEALTKPFILPVTIVTGFLGAGKTTLLKSLLAKKRNLRLAALVNDFGAVNHDVQLLDLASSPSTSHHHEHHEHQHGHLLGKAERVKGLEGGCVCCAPALQEGMRGEVWSLLQQPGSQGGALAGPVGEGMVDYLVIETSGVTDPEGLIRALDEKFGKMTRARLDAVVTVVDADALEGEGGEWEGVALARQLACADVILLNKVDLLDEARLAAVEQRIRATNPLAHVHKTRYCDVPLQFVLDVDLPTDGGAGPAMTHETSAAAYATRAARAEAPHLRSDASRAVAQKNKLTTTNSLFTGTVAAAPQPAPPDEHLAADGLASVTFTAPAPLRLARLQEFFAWAFPSPLGGGIVRAKGFLHVRELPGRRLSLSVSGRRRVHIRDEGAWAGAPHTELVLIGRAAAGFDSPGLLAALEGACEDGEEEGEGNEGAAAAAAAAHAARLRAAIAEDSRMEVVDPREAVGPLWRRLRRGGGRKRPPPDAEGDEEDAAGAAPLPHWIDAVLAFRLTGAGSLGVTSEHLRLQHGVDVDGLNHRLQERVNMAGKPADGVLLWPLPLPEGKGLALCFAVGPEAEAEARARAAWDDVVAPAAAAVMDQSMSHLKLCKCGH